jgi:mannose/fructose/N-acetylgalactosamine-specific phosphotransferase system component IIC
MVAVAVAVAVAVVVTDHTCRTRTVTAYHKIDTHRRLVDI